jgi:serine/threonine protein kinase
MTTCKECASEISENEAFCPYCGIKIERAVEPAPPQDAVVAADPEFESTIVITPGEAAAMKDQLLAAPVAPPPSPFDPPPAPERKTAPTLEDIPAPSILTGGFARPTDPGFSLEEDATPTKETPVFDDQVIPEPPPVFEPAPQDDQPVGAFAVEEPETPYVDEPVEVPVFEETTPQPESVSEPSSEIASNEPVFEPASSGEPAADLPIIDEPVAPGSPAADPVAETPKEPTFELAPLPEPEAVSPGPQPDFVSSREAVASESEGLEQEPPKELVFAAPQDSTPATGEEPISISKPREELEEPVSPPSMFDSVQIMEGTPLPDAVDTVIPGANFQMPVVVAPQEPVQPESAPKSADLASSGIGRGDTDGRKSAKLKPLLEGTVLNNRYEIVRKIGGGGMGAVYLASDNNLGGVLRAVKEMVQAHIEEDQQEKAINDFKRESMILSTLDHPSIPTIYDYFYDAEEGRFYLVMKYISGGDLASRLRASPDGKIEELTVTEWAIQLTDVLNYLHNQPSTIVYRDLKPSNIMLDGNSSRVMLIDFGIARNISQKEEKGVTAVGTMGYAPPELFSGNVEPRSDIYSLGSTMFHLLTGADPQSNPLLIFDFQKNPRPRQINSRLSDQMERILMRAVEYNADSRFSSAAELKAVLEEHLTNLRSGNLTFGVTEAPVSVSLANQSVFCGFCGQRIVATDLFCAFCGAKQPLAQQGVHAEIYHTPASTARLVIEGTSELSAPIYALQKDDNLIGRRDPMSNIFPEVDLSKYDPQTKISRRHAKIWRDGTAFMLEDLGSSNGTIIEGGATNVFKLPAHQPYKLSSGDRIKIGDTRLHFVVG